VKAAALLKGENPAAEKGHDETRKRKKGESRAMVYLLERRMITDSGYGNVRFAKGESKKKEEADFRLCY